MVSDWYELDYSPNELKLIDHFGYRNSVEEGSSVSPPKLYQFMAVKAFLAGDTSPYAEALRRGMLCMEQNIYRHTPEFEKAIEVEEV